MSSITNPSITPNPNSSSNSHKSKRKCAALPEEIWYLILTTLSTRTFDILVNVQKVCKSFHKICKQPSMFKVINMKSRSGFDMNAMTRNAVDRSKGGCVDISLDYTDCDDHTLKYVVERCKNLKRLRFADHVEVSDGELIEAVKKLPMLAELQLIICLFSSKTVKEIGHACPSLQSFSLTLLGSKRRERISNDDALAISSSMPNLRHLQLIGNFMTNYGLKAILDECPLLESLDLRTCFHIDLSGDLGKRCQERIKHLQYPNDSTADYDYQACFYEPNLDEYYKAMDNGNIIYPEELLDYYLGKGDIENFKIWREIYRDYLGSGSSYLESSDSEGSESSE